MGAGNGLGMTFGEWEILGMLLIMFVNSIGHIAQLLRTFETKIKIVKK